MLWRSGITNLGLRMWLGAPKHQTDVNFLDLDPLSHRKPYLVCLCWSAPASRFVNDRVLCTFSVDLQIDGFAIKLL
ncbi:hypothetical protein GCM10010919_23270 [Alishewanella longhuensis]|uniref:Uncharacterized protein n=1 Tax=Alishewanella longhuensis TaxID=1091037 RepID=A0ABQ3KZD4_9ALTE|nr:hypothetical protein GCM10010919_23270 [Alishewanella longhuensis]